MAKIITAEDFNTLPMEERANILWKYATFLNEVIEYGKFRVCIYELFNFFVGVFYDVHTNSIVKIEILKMDLADQLLKKISLN